ncbi:hypothetical protein [Paraburkholderia susongensis]|uniref:Uncharacterized protein n=1 Tax=Paraburkholderia susongensis TaxID=1515439 RepID=A0A1X7KM81_9BURK|nr:hypothetical protein [Paraburkholderia susongensis]SMG42566.1 hypothetical protein SAMN06265784_10478 [Paraburkholderia susongensis]
MIQMMMATTGRSAAARDTQRRYRLAMRRAIGFAIVVGGFAVIVAQALQHAFG